jgi:hypothetical protein
MDERRHINEHCMMGFSHCGLVFSSRDTCFVAYSFQQTLREIEFFKKSLAERGIEPVTARERGATGRRPFCRKICAEIIRSRFCIALINNDELDGREVPNANVYMELGLMLGLRKYVIPFQRASQKVVFNAAGLNIIRYRCTDMERLTAEEIDKAVGLTRTFANH